MSLDLDQFYENQGLICVLNQDTVSLESNRNWAVYIDSFKSTACFRIESRRVIFFD